MQQAQQLGRYHLLDRVAFGGMAEIYRAKTADAQGRLHLVAVKRVLAHLCEDDEFIQMLIDEARLTAMLKHPNIARVYEFCRTPNEYFISMEYVDGKDLRAMLEKARQNQEWLPEEHIAYICMHVARGLDAAHNQTDRSGNPLNIVHRDVSPSNVLLSYAGEVKLCDFGIAKASSSRAQTKTGVIKGKVKYMSPEQAMGRKLDRRSDLFSLGTLLYEMLALQAPFTAATEIELLFAVRDARKRPIRELRPHLNGDLEVIIERAMAKSRSQRFQNGEEFAATLQAFLDTYYPHYNVAQLSRYMLRTFEREREREQRVLDEYVISSGSADSVGENLLADVLGPDAEYTQFTAAFSQMNPGHIDLAASAANSYSNAPNPMQQMRVLSSVSMSGMDDADAMPTREKPRLSPDDYGLGRGAGFSPSAQTMPRSSVQVQDSANETAILNRDAPQHGLPSLHSEPTAIVSEQQTNNLLYNDGLHAQETHILSRDQVDALLARRGVKPQSQSQPAPPAQPSPPRVVIEPQSLADEPELHDASTQILSMNSLPANVREILQRKAGAASAPAPAPAAPAPVAAPLPSAMPSLKLQPLESDFHDAATAYLDWSPLEPAQQSELPMPEPSAIHPVRPQPGRSPTGAQAPIAAPPPLSTPRPASTPQLSTPRPTSTPQLNTPRPTSSPQVGTPRPTSSPQVNTSRPAEPPAQPRVAAPVQPQPSVAPAVGPGLGEEWESLPHLDSTMISRGGSMPIERPGPAAPAPMQRSTLARLNVVDQGDMPTVPPPLSAAPAPVEEPPEHTLNTEELDLPAPSGQFDDLPTPVKSGPALRDLGIDAQADFAEDTSKGGLPRGLSPNAHAVDAGQYLSDDDLETID